MQAQALGELPRGELQAEQQQQQHHADGRARADEVAGGRDRRHAALAQGQAGQQVERDGGEPEAPGRSRGDAQDHEDGAEFHEQGDGDLHGAGLGADDGLDARDALGRSHHHEHVAGAQELGGRGRGDHVVAAHDGHD